MQRQRRSASTNATTEAAAEVPAKRRRRTPPPFLAAVRLADGSRNIYEVSNAKDVADAHRMILEELTDVVSAVIVVRD